MDITHNVRTCTANLNCDCEPTGLLLGVKGGTKARYINRDSRNCSGNHGTASKLSRRGDSTFPDENQRKLYRIISENETEAKTPDEHGLQNENSKAAGASQTESASDSVAAKAKRSNSLKVRSDFACKSGCAQPHQLTQKSRNSAKAANNNGNPTRPVKKSGDKLPPTSGQVLGVKAKTVPSKYSSKSSSRGWQVKEKKETSKDPSNLSSNMSSSNQVHRGQPSQKRKCSAEAVKKSRNQTQAVKKSGKKIPPTPEQENERKEPSKYPSNLSIKMSSVNRVHRGQPGQKSKCSAEAVKKSRNQTQAVKISGNQIAPTFKQEKEKKEPSEGPSDLPTKISSSDRASWDQPVQKSKCSAEAVRKSGNQIRPTSWKEKENKEPSKGASNLSTKMIPSDRVRKGPDQKRKCSTVTVENSINQSEAVKKRRNQLPAIPKQVWQVKRKITSSQDSGKTSSKVSQVKKKTSTLSSKTSSSHAKQRRQHQRSRSFSPEHYIKWDGFVKLGHNCFLCENDLAHSPLPTDEELESDKLPDVALLPCGHAFHTLCLEQAIPEDQLKDPSCFICASLQ